MKTRNKVAIAFALSVSIIALITIFDSINRTFCEYYWQSFSHDFQLFKGDLHVKVSRNKLEFSKDEKTQEITLNIQEPKNVLLGGIKKYFEKNGGISSFGEPLQGEEFILSDSYRVHVFKKSIIVWRKKDFNTEDQKFLCHLNS